MRRALQVSRTRRADVGPWSVAGYLSAIAVLLASMSASAGPRISEIKVAEQGETETVIVIEADQAPTFQVFGEGLAYTVELPGADVGGAKVKRPSSALLLNTIELDKKTARARLTFHGDVDYDARIHGRRLVVTFTHLGERATLEQLRSLRDEVATLRAKQGKLNGESVVSSKAAKEELARIEAEVQRLTTRKKAIDVEIEARAKARASADEALQRLNAQKGEAQREVKTSQDQAQQLKRGNAALEKQAAAKRGEVAALEKERGRLAAEAKKAAAAQKAFEAESAQKRADLEKERKRLEVEVAAEARKIKIKEDLAVLERDIAAKRTIVDKLTRARAEREQAIAQLNSQSRTLTAEVENLTRASSGLQKRVEQDRAAAAAATRATSDANAEANRARDEAKTAAIQRDRMTREVSALSQRHEDLKDKVASLSAQQGDAAAAVAALQREERSARTRLAELKSEVSRLDERTRVARATPAPRVATPLPKPRASTAPRVAARPTGFGGSGPRSIDLKRGPTNLYERASDFLDDEEIGRGALSSITVQARGGGSRIGVRVDGGAQYNVRRVKNEIILTLFDTRAANLDVRRIVDARNLGTNVLRVLPHIEESDRSRVELTIELRNPGDKVRVGHDDAMLWLLVG